MTPLFFRRVPPSQVWGASIVVLLILAASWWFHIGPWPWGIATQLAVIGVTSFQLNVLVLLVGSLVPVMVVLGAYHHQLQTPVQEKPDLAWIAAPPGKAFLVTAMFSVACVAFVGRGLLAGDGEAVPIERATTTSASFLSLPLGAVDDQQAVEMDDDDYLPLLHEGEIVAAFKVKDTAGGDLSGGWGMRQFGGIPGGVVAFWEAERLRVHPNAPLVEVGSTPTESLFVGGLMGLIAVPVGLWGLWLRRRERLAEA